MARKCDDKFKNIPDFIDDTENNKTYKRMRFFGKGGFAKCYEILDIESRNIFAGKIVSKEFISKHKQREKMTQEIAIHRTLSHPNVVQFHGFFEDTSYIYIMLELCKNRSMRELQKRRKNITEFECRYYISQIISGVKYLHDNRVIHRDLKLGNLFLDNKLHVKIGDFGLATRIEFDGERKKTICGTPNYIAPEILTKKGHSFEVDIWSIGCIMYTLLVGHAPFETKSLKDTYSKIKKCEYCMPHYLRKSAADMVCAMLQLNPFDRPNINKLISFEFLASAPVRSCLPKSCLTMAPRISVIEAPSVGNLNSQQPLMEATDDGMNVNAENNILHDTITESVLTFHHNEDCRGDIASLYHQLTSLLEATPKIINDSIGDENTDPAAQPLFWVSKWVDYSEKYGFGYQLSDEGIGVVFNDTTKIILLPNEINVHYIDEEGKETYMTTTNYCEALNKKMQLLFYFKRYMTEHLLTAGGETVGIENDQISRMPHLHSWFRTTCAVVMHLTNGTVQLNFSDHNKIVLCPRMSAVTYLDAEKNFYTYRFSTILQNGCSDDLYQKLRYAHMKTKKLLENMSIKPLQ